MSFAVPDDDARYLIPGEIVSFTTEFFANPAPFTWDVAIQRESDPAWKTLRTWHVFRMDHPQPTTYGSRTTKFGGRTVIEISNTAGSGAYFPAGTVFELKKR